MELPLNVIQKRLLALERFFPYYHREQAERALFALSILFLSFSLLTNVLAGTPAGTLWPVAEGLFLVAFALLLNTILLEVYFHSLRMQLEEHHEMSFATLLIIGLHHPKKKDLAKAFLHSRIGKGVAMRLGIGHEMIHHFMQTKDPVHITLPSKGHFHDLAGHLHDEDPYFRDFLERVHVTREHLIGAAASAERRHHRALSSRPLLQTVFGRGAEPLFSLEHAVHDEIHELERFYRIIITEQATQLIIAYFREDLIRYVSESSRGTFLTELIESVISDHQRRFHGASVILPADVRQFIIHQKSLCT